MALKRKPPSCFSGEPRSTSCLTCNGCDEREEERGPPEEAFAEIVGDDCTVNNNIPIDRGWAWVICAGCFVVTYIMSLYDQVLAVMFVDVVDKFEVPVSTATVVFTIQAFTFSAGSVISTNIIVPKFGVRVVIVTAAIANSLSTIVIAFSPNITFYLIFHLFKGLSIGSMWIPALGLLGHYFQRCRSVATSITNAGISVSLLITPIFVRELLDNVGFSGTLLIVSGVEMQAVAIGMLLRPPSRGLFDLNLLGDWLMRILLASTVLGALLQYIPTYIPTLAVQKGLDKTSAAVLLTVCGGVNLVSTLLQGFVIDAKVITAAKFIAICQFIVGTMCHLTHVLTSFPTLLLLSVTQGLFGGSRMSLMPVLAMDFVGLDNLSKALGFNAMIATLSLSLHHPFLGYLLQKTSSFAVPFHYVGIALYISAGLLLLEPCGRSLNNRRTHREHDN